MRRIITAAALSLAIAAPAFAEEPKPAVTPSVNTAKQPAEPPKAQITTSTQTTLPAAKPADPATVVKPGDVKKDDKKVDPKAANPAGGAPKADAAKGGVSTTTEKPAETKKQ